MSCNPALSSARPILSFRRLALLALAAMAFALMATVPATRGPLATPVQAHHWPSKCGGVGKRPCRLLEHVPSCRPGLVEDFAKDICRKPQKLPTLLPRTNCGKEGQTPCKLPIVPSCDEGLAEDFLQGRCVRAGADMVAMAGNLIHDSGGLAKNIALGLAGCQIENLVAGLRKSTPIDVARARAERAAQLPCMRDALQSANRAGFQTLTVGMAGGAAAGVGGEAENGLAFDTSLRPTVSTYHSLALKFNSLGGGVSFVVGLHKGHNRGGSGGFDGDGHGATGAIAGAVGTSIAAEFNYDGSVSGLTVGLEAGGKAELAYFRGMTVIGATFDAYRPPQAISTPSPSFPGASRPNRPEPVAVAPVPAPPPAPAPASVGDAILQGILAGVSGAAAERADRTGPADKAWARFCNKSQSDTVSIAIAYAVPARGVMAANITSEGWWPVKRKKCTRIPVPTPGLSQGETTTILWFGREPDGNHYEGQDGTFCVVDKVHTYRNADTRDCDGEGDYRVTGHAFDVQAGQTVTMNLRE